MQTHARLTGALLLVLGTALVFAPLTAHVDDGDGQLYLTVARHLVEDGGWFDLRYLRGAYPHFREHLPFGLWPYALALRTVGEGAAPVLAGLLWVATLALVWRLGARLLGEWPGALALATIVLNDSAFRYAARPRLDPPVLVLATAAAGLVLLATRPRTWLLAALLAALATLVKGPFGLLPPLAAAAARVLLDRSLRTLLWSTLLAVLAVAPLALFLLHDRASGDGSWWEGYLQAQLLASARGARTDGDPQWWIPLRTIGERFWPGLVFVPFGAFVAARGDRSDPERTRRLRLVALTALFVVVGLCLPRRKLWHHALVAYPFLALLAAGALRPTWIAWLDRHARPFARATGAIAALALVALLAGGGRLLAPAPCTVSSEFSADLAALPAGTPVVVVGQPTQWMWGRVAQLAAERHLDGWPAERLPLEENHVSRARVALVREGQLPPALGPWHVVRAARGEVLLRRD